ncbi:hypothetical protein COCMIDRAFT_107763 [Bipolaris oryzae ATCC 44560]|uniref:DUF1989 domain-containing protein n=1 Tax=Bipolaris oryzae ATCC 44560 TaxID=930090 RepID=W6YT99_COCMI|nr:uncharacterized protein COCMIDRAFT_107763 [Bipolaris oryzae ATCC 44560]EUC40830.1 hypothetical protein COCMIDRAFT_107763 [Bipolaris oryzae ATCC 44560]
MSGELQTIPARHGAATFVPRGRTIKVINTYGKQVVSMWAFTLGPPPEEGEGEELSEEEVKKEAEEIKRVVEEGEKKEEETIKEDKEIKKEGGEGESEEKKESKDGESGKKKETKDGEKETQSSEDTTNGTSQDTPTPPEKAPDTPENEKTTESTEPSSKQPPKRTWASYLPSIPYRNKGAANKQETEQKPSAEQVKKQNEENTKKWSSYLPTGKSFSSYVPNVPNVEVPDSKSVISAFKSSHYRDPNKSYAEQLYDFSKTPVGAGTMAAATGSGYASSVYAAYSAYASMHPSNASQPPMEYLSLPHTRTASHKLVPEVNDELLTNLRNPILTLIEDTSPGAHDTLTAACDANQYAALGIDKPAEHGSCAENLVLALKEINETSGLKGAKAVGADITVNIAPTPLHLFMNAPLHAEGDIHDDGAGAKGVTLSVEEPQGKKRCYVRFRAERDVVVVFSACPMDVGKQNGGRCMASNFMVEEVKEGEEGKKGEGKVDVKEEEEKEKERLSEEPKPKKKPKKLEVRSQSAAPVSS